MKRQLGFVVGVSAGLLAVFLVTHRGPARSPHPNVLLVTIDTLRADRLGCYGYAGARTPILDGVAAGGVRFTTAVVHVPLTTPSHASILTGLTPLRHGVRDNGDFALPDGVPSVAEAFRRAGYATAAFVSGFPLDRRFGLARGFETYDDRLPRGDDRRRSAYVERPADQTTRAVERWLDGRKGPWFLWVHYFDPHSPYEPPPDLAARFQGRPYDGEVAFVDQEIGVLLRRIDQAGARERPVVLVTSDHGEALGEHGEETHGVFLYDATLRVPWILAGPGVLKGRPAATVARAIDAAPTLLDVAGLPPLPGAEGRSLWPAARGESMPDAPAYAESLFARRHLGWAPLHAWRTARFKLIEAPRPELYALDTDSAEMKEVYREHEDVATSLRASLRTALATDTPGAPAAPAHDTAERLKALGYLSGAGPAPASLRDPKDGIGLLNRMEHGIAAARADPAAAARELAAVLAEDPHLTLARRYRALALSQGGDHAGAVREVEALERDGTGSFEDLILLADSLRLLGRPADALPVLDRAERMQPRSPEPLLTRAHSLVALGRPVEAAAAYERVLSLSPGHPEGLRGLGELALARGDLPRAATAFETILFTDPSELDARLKLGVVRMREGRVEDALKLFREAVERDPTSAEALLDLGGALARSGRAAEAVPYLERAVDAGSRSTVALNGLGFARLEAGDEAGALGALRLSLSVNPRQPQVAETVSRLMQRATPPGASRWR